MIGITCSTRRSTPAYHWQSPLEQDSQNRDYVRAVVEAGGAPVLLPCVGEKDLVGAMLQRLDGLIISGGHDMDPRYFGEEPVPGLETIDPPRDALDETAIGLALQRDEFPILAICRGIQVLNILMGGTLYQDLPLDPDARIQHRQRAPREYATHAIAVEPRSRLCEILGSESVRVNSFHHQTVARVAEGLRVTARAPDGVIEAMEAPDHPFCIAVQWHPEHLTRDYEHARRLFVAFVDACGQLSRG
ncbi:MAG: gamma-glutamyl-gamma-aminobutyrate hydrolase family protein [Armatimonadota bacterium]